MSALTLPPGVRLTQFQHRLLAHLDRCRARPQGICFGSRTIAEALGVAVRTVQAGLKRLRDLGLLSRVWDYALRTRRRFFLGPTPAPAAAPETAPEPNSFGAPPCAHSAHADAPTDRPPLDPPIRSLETTEERVVVVVDSPAEAHAETEPVGPPPPPLSLPTGEGPPIPRAVPAPAPKANPDQVAGLKERAQALFGRGEDVAAWIVSVARRWHLRPTLRALDRAEAKVKAGKPVRTDYVEVAAKQIHAEGIVPLAAVATPRPKATAPAPAPAPVFARPRVGAYDERIRKLTALVEDPAMPESIRADIREQLDRAVAARKALDEPGA